MVSFATFKLFFSILQLTYFSLPSGELDVLFANRVPARAFKDAKADQYTDNGHVSEKMEVSEKIEA